MAAIHTGLQHLRLCSSAAAVATRVCPLPFPHVIARPNQTPSHTARRASPTTWFSTFWHSRASVRPSRRRPCAAASADIAATSTAAEELTPLPSGTSAQEGVRVRFVWCVWWGFTSSCHCHCFPANAATGFAKAGSLPRSQATHPRRPGWKAHQQTVPRAPVPTPPVPPPHRPPS